MCAQGVKSHEYKYKFFTRVAREIGYLHFSAPSRGNREEGYVCMRIWRGKFLFHRERERKRGSGKNENENNTVSCECGMLDAPRETKCEGIMKRGEEKERKVRKKTARNIARNSRDISIYIYISTNSWLDRVLPPISILLNDDRRPTRALA